MTYIHEIRIRSILGALLMVNIDYDVSGRCISAICTHSFVLNNIPQCLSFQIPMASQQSRSDVFASIISYVTQLLQNSGDSISDIDNPCNDGFIPIFIQNTAVSNMHPKPTLRLNGNPV